MQFVLIGNIKLKGKFKIGIWVWQCHTSLFCMHTHNLCYVNQPGGYHWLFAAFVSWSSVLLQSFRAAIKWLPHRCQGSDFTHSSQLELRVPSDHLKHPNQLKTQNNVQAGTKPFAMDFFFFILNALTDSINEWITPF